MTDTIQRPCILVPVDFSTHSEQALLKACELSECMEDPLLILHVIHDPAEMQGYYSAANNDNQLSDIEDLASSMFNDYLTAVRKRNPEFSALQEPETLLLSGLPVTKILQVVEKYKPSMVVMGSQGHTGLKHLWLGSIAAQIVQLCPVPVTVVKQPESEVEQ